MADLPAAGEIWERKISGTQDEYASVRIMSVGARFCTAGEWVYKVPHCPSYGRRSWQLLSRFLRQYRRVTTTSAAQAAGRE